jgi:hypothetical protein
LAAFERIKKLKGTSQATSTKGWEERQQFRLIARGSCVAIGVIAVNGCF